jgi:hypothetical protein
MIMAGGPTDEVKQPVDPVRTEYRKGRGGSGHDVVRGAVIRCYFFWFLFFWFQDHRDFVCAPPPGGGARQILMNVNNTPTHLALPIN